MTNIDYKYPHTPILAFNKFQNVRNDKILDSVTIQKFLSNPISIEEKIDGSNLGISFNKEGEIILQNRGHIITPSLRGQWLPLNNWIKCHEDQLFDLLSDKYILFGEWCYAKHSIFYSQLTDWFLAFDIYDKVVHKFFSVCNRNNLLKSTNISVVPLLAYGKFSLKELLNFSLTSKLGNELAEGIYLRYDKNDYLVERAKIVRKDFSQSIQTHWKKKSIICNVLLKNKAR